MHGRLECADKLWRRENKAELGHAIDGQVPRLHVFDDVDALLAQEIPDVLL